jgi:DNA recombination protein RmuC
MIELLLIASSILLLAIVALLAFLLVRTRPVDLSPLANRLSTIEESQGRWERRLSDEFCRSRQEISTHSHELREELQLALKGSIDSLVQSVQGISESQQVRLEDFAARLSALKQSEENSASQVRLELADSLSKMREAQEKRLTENTVQLQHQFASFGGQLSDFGKSSQADTARIRTELATTLNTFRDSIEKQTSATLSFQKQQFDSFASQLSTLIDKSEKKSDDLRTAVERKLTEIQFDNTAKLEEMRKTVDEKLEATLDRRLGESFKQVSDRLEQVHKGLGEMQSLATGVGDLKRVLSNVKTRGTWGEIQLGTLLEQILTCDQFACNVKTKPGEGSTVEFAIKLPGPQEDDVKTVWLPIDAKFPKEDYERLVDAADRGDAAGVEQAARDLEARVRSEARDISNKYLAPPNTTDFGLLYLPTEGLYAEVLRRPGLLDSLQREQRVVVVGPTTLAALLNSLQMGFRTLAIQKRSSEVWKLLGAVKTQFGKFGDLLEKVRSKLDETGNTIDAAVSRSRQIEKRLKQVEALPTADAVGLLPEGQALETDEEPVQAVK